MLFASIFVSDMQQIQQLWPIARPAFLYIIYIKTHLHLQTLPLPSHASFQPDIGSVMEHINFPPFSPTYCRNFLTCWWRAFLGLTSSSCNPVTSPPSGKPLSKKRVLWNPPLARFIHCEVLQNLQRFRNHIKKKWKQQCWTIFPTASISGYAGLLVSHTSYSSNRAFRHSV